MMMKLFSSLLFLLPLFLGLDNHAHSAFAFQPLSSSFHNLSKANSKVVGFNPLQSSIQRKSSQHNRIRSTKLFESGEDGNEEGGPLDRFLSPKIDDAGLPIADTLLAQIVAPTFQIFWLSANRAPLPTWLFSTQADGALFNTVSRQGSLIAPTLIHGAGLAVCWALGALSAKAFESDAFNISGGRGYGTVILRIVQAGSFAIGVLIFSTQLDLFLEYGRYVQPGESEEIDVRLLSAIVELINDIVFEAGVLGAWRLYRASLTGDASGRPPNYDPYQ